MRGDVAAYYAPDPRTAFDLALTQRGGDTFVGRRGLGIERPEHREAELWFQIRADL